MNGHHPAGSAPAYKFMGLIWIKYKNAPGRCLIKFVISAHKKFSVKYQRQLHIPVDMGKLIGKLRNIKHDLVDLCMLDNLYCMYLFHHFLKIFLQTLHGHDPSSCC